MNPHSVHPSLLEMMRTSSASLPSLLFPVPGLLQSLINHETRPGSAFHSDSFLVKEGGGMKKHQTQDKTEKCRLRSYEETLCKTAMSSGQSHAAFCFITSKCCIKYMVATDLVTKEQEF